jgi:hypothetical protein
MVGGEKRANVPMSVLATEKKTRSSDLPKKEMSLQVEGHFLFGEITIHLTRFSFLSQVFGCGDVSRQT